MENIYKKGKIPVVTGGTGFYIQALLYDINFDDTDADSDFRTEMYRLAEEKGNEYVHGLLKEVDPVSASEIHFNNIKRVIRALEYHNQTGKKISEHNEEQRQKVSPYDFKYYVLNMDREKLYERINLRVDIMLENGLLDEVKKLKDMGYSKDLVSMQGIGYKEIREYADGNVTYDEAVETLKKNTRNFAKRQLTWFRREESVTWLNHEDFDCDKDKILSFMLEDLKEII